MKLAKALAAAVLVASPILLAGCSSDKPSVEEIKSSLVDLLKEKGGSAITDDIANSVADCAAPKLRDELDADVLNDLVEGQNGGGSASEGAAATKILTDCATSATGGS